MRIRPPTLAASLSFCFFLGCLTLSTTCPAQTWTQVKPTTSPSARWQHYMSFDFVSGRTVLFGGRPANNSYLNDTWEYDGKVWTQIKTATAPSGRWLSQMVYNRSQLRSVLFGGLSQNGQLADTWVYDSIKKTWTQMQPKNSPSARYTALAYDSARNRVVLFSGSSRTQDTWEWDGSNWTRMQPKNSPPARSLHSMTYDSARKRVVLYGGVVGSNYPQDTWEYDGVTWSQIKTANTPVASCCAYIAYDSARQRTVLFGGSTSTVQNQNGTWEYDGNNWTQMKPATSPPVRRDFDQMVYDSRRGRMVLFGGFGNGAPRHMNDTWEYVGPQGLTGAPSTISITTGGTHTFTLNAGSPHASRLYWIFGSVTGTSPGVTLASAVGSVTIPLNPDFYTDLTIALANTPLLTKTRGALDASGKASAAFNVPKITNQSAIGVKFYHAFLVYDAQSNFYMASNPVELMLTK